MLQIFYKEKPIIISDTVKSDLKDSIPLLLILELLENIDIIKLLK